MEPYQYDLDIDQGASFQFTIEGRNSDGTLIDWTGWSARAQLRSTFSSSTVVAEFGISFNIPLGCLIASLSQAQTILIPTDPARDCNKFTTCYAWDLEVTDPNGFKIRFLEGHANVSPETTR